MQLVSIPGNSGIWFMALFGDSCLFFMILYFICLNLTSIMELPVIFQWSCLFQAVMQLDFSPLYEMMGDSIYFKWIKSRIERMSPRWVQACKEVSQKTGFEKRKRKKVHVTLSLSIWFTQQFQSITKLLVSLDSIYSTLAVMSTYCHPVELFVSLTEMICLKEYQSWSSY